MKACICGGIQPNVWPERRFSTDIHTHDLAKLLNLTGLGIRLVDNAQRAVNWNVVKDWTETSRYEVKAAEEAADLLAAVSDPNEGVLAWLMQYW